MKSSAASIVWVLQRVSRLHWSKLHTELVGAALESFRWSSVLLYFHLSRIALNSTPGAVDDQIMSRAISLYTDRVTLSLDALQDLEQDAEALAKRRRTRSPNAPPDEGTDDSPYVDPRGWRSWGFLCVFCAIRNFWILARIQSGIAQLLDVAATYFHTMAYLLLWHLLLVPSGSS